MGRDEIDVADPVDEITVADENIGKLRAKSPRLHRSTIASPLRRNT